jgi:hypothetical protein
MLKNRTEPHREKSINHAGDELGEPFQRDLVAVPGLIPYLNLAFPRLITGPLEGGDHVSSTCRRGGGGNTCSNTNLSGVSATEGTRPVCIPERRGVAYDSA